MPEATSAITLGFLLRRLQTTTQRWDLAMRRDGYPEPDDPNERDFTDDDWALYGWADAWRCATHEVEGELAQTPEYRAAFTDVGFVTASEPTVYQGELSPEALAQATRGSACGINLQPRAFKPKRTK